MKDSMAEQVDRNDGTNFEKYLGMLIRGRQEYNENRRI